MGEEEIPDCWEDLDAQIPESVVEGAIKVADFDFTSNHQNTDRPLNMQDANLSQMDHNSLSFQHYSQQKTEKPKANPEEKKIPKPRKTEPELVPAINKEGIISSLIDANKTLEIKLAEPDTRDPVNLVFIGHVDAGKSTVCGNILLKTEKINRRVVEQYEEEAKENNRESWWLAYIMDISEEERIKGITIEVGRAFFETDLRRFTILDAPGHKSYVPNMISSAAQADVAAIVISARKGEFESGFERGGQTTEHTILARAMGVKNFIVLVTKMDDPSVCWSQERFEFIKASFSQFLRNTCKIVDENIFWVPISGLYGLNLNEKVPADICPWYQGLCLFELLNIIPLPDRNSNESLRIPILDKIKDVGLSALGKVERGSVVKGLKTMIMPIEAEAEIQELYGPEDVKYMYAKTGENLRLKLKVSEGVEIQPGYVICDIHDICNVATEFEADLILFDLLPQKMLVCPGYECVIHLNSILQDCQVTQVIARYDENKHKKIKVDFCRGNSRVIVRLSTPTPICVERYVDFPPLGRFTLRDEDTTIGIGKITNISYSD